MAAAYSRRVPTPHQRHVECRPACRNVVTRATKHGSGVVVDSLVLHVVSILAPPPYNVRITSKGRLMRSVLTIRLLLVRML